MTRISEHFALGSTQATLDFVDVDATGDTKLFVDPRAIERLDTDWGRWAHELLRDFFERLIAAVRDDRRDDAMLLMPGLGEADATAPLSFGSSLSAMGSSSSGRTSALSCLTTGRFPQHRGTAASATRWR